MEPFRISWARIPFFRYTMALIAGVLVGVYLPLGEGWGWPLFAFGLLWLIVLQFISSPVLRWKWEKFTAIPVVCAIFGLGLILVDHHTLADRPDHFSKEAQGRFLKAEVIEVPQEKAKTFKFILKVEASDGTEEWEPMKGRLLAYIQKSEGAGRVEIGDVLVFPNVYQEVNPPANPGEFDYKRFLSFKDINQQTYIPEGQWIKVERRWRLRAMAERARSYLRERVGSVGMSKDEEAIASALLLGKKDELGPELSRSYASAGAMHVLAVSGLHVGIIYFILQGLFKLAGLWRKGRLGPSVIVISGLWVYAFVTGLSPSVVRAATMFSAVTLAHGMGRHSDIYNTIASSAFLLLLFNPFYIMEVGFQLSYLAVIGIIFLHPKIYGLLYFPSKLWNKVWEITCVSLAAQLATFPLGLLYFHQFPTYFLLSNLLVIPAAFVILYFGVAYFALGWLPGIGFVLGKALSYSILMLNQSVLWVETLPGSLLSGIDIGILETWLMYLMILASTVYVFYQRRSALVLATAILALLMVLQVQEVYTLKRFDHLVVYDVRGQSAINLVGQETNLLFCDSLLAHSPDRQQFHLRNNWNRLNAPEPDFIVRGRADGLHYLGDALFGYKGRTFCRLDRSGLMDELAEDSISVDYLILSYYQGMRPERIFKTIKPSKVILDSSIKGRTLERIKEHLSPDVPMHAVAEKGFYMSSL